MKIRLAGDELLPDQTPGSRLLVFEDNLGAAVPFDSLRF